MGKNIKYRTLVLTLLMSLSCNSVTGVSTSLAPTLTPTLDSTLLIPTGHGPQELTAKATSPDSVLLSWLPVEGATFYRIAVSVNGGHAFAIMELDSSTTSYEDFIAVPGSPLTYAVEALSDSDSIGQSIVNVTTAQRQPNPLTVDAQLDATKTASAKIIPDAGGSISLTDSKGVEYKLDIPAGALVIPTDITLTAVKEIGALPLDGGLLGAVKIEPDGLVLNEVATLTIVLPENQASNDLATLGFAFSGNGTEFHLKPVYDQNIRTSLMPVFGGAHLSSMARQNGASIVMETLVMYGIGIGAGTAQNAAELVRASAPTDSDAALDQQTAAAMAQIPQAFINQREGILTDAHAFMSGAVSNIAIQGASNCGELKKAISSMESWLIHTDTWARNGADKGKLGDIEKELWDQLTDKMGNIVQNATEDCEKKPEDKTTEAVAAEVGCLDALLVKIANSSGSFYEKLRSKMTRFGNDTAISDQIGKLDKCLPSYIASGNLEGEICHLDHPYKLDTSGELSLEAQFNPTSALSGEVELILATTAVCTWDGGHGTYVVHPPDKAGGIGVMFLTVSNGGVSCPEGDFSYPFLSNLIVYITPLTERPAMCIQP